MGQVAQNGQLRSTQRHVCRQSGKDVVLAGELRRFATKHPRAGYRMAHKQLRREGGKANLKRVAEALEAGRPTVPRKQHRGGQPAPACHADQRGVVLRLCLYHTGEGKRLKWLPICDEFTRESIALAVKRRMEAADKKLRAERRERWVIAESAIRQ